MSGSCPRLPTSTTLFTPRLISLSPCLTGTEPPVAALGVVDAAPLLLSSDYGAFVPRQSCFIRPFSLPQWFRPPNAITPRSDLPSSPDKPAGTSPTWLRLPPASSHRPPRDPHAGSATTPAIDPPGPAGTHGDLSCRLPI